MDCNECNGACCRYIAVLKSSFQREFNVLLYLRGAKSHGEHWFLPIPCKNLNENGRCSQYQDRPAICKRIEPGTKMCLACREVEQYGDE